MTARMAMFSRKDKMPIASDVADAVTSFRLTYEGAAAIVRLHTSYEPQRAEIAAAVPGVAVEFARHWQRPLIYVAEAEAPE